MTEPVEMTKEKIISAIRVLWQKGHLAAGDGNFSFKDSEGCIWITPSGCRKCDLTALDFVKLSDSDRASSESRMHEKVYELSNKAKVVLAKNKLIPFKEMSSIKLIK